jgi:GTPase SAR1 family protein
LKSCYIKTTGLYTSQFEHNGVQFRVIDTGGQRCERNKWFNLFKIATAVVFVAALSQYDELCYEDEITNKVIESLKVLENLGQMSELSDIPFYLYLNKQDIFLNQLTKENISNAFPEIPRELNTKYEPDIIENRMSFKSQLKLNQSWIDIQIVGDGIKLEDLSEDILSYYDLFEFQGSC